MSRITNAMLTTNYLSDLQTNLRSMNTLQNQLSTGKTIQRASQDVSAANQIMQLNTEISANQQYSSNITDTTNWLDTTDTALSEGGNVLSRIRQLMVKAGNGTYTEDEISSIKDEVVSAVQELGQVFNTSFNGNYIFGGTKSTSKPINVDSDGNMSYADADGNSINKGTDGSTTVKLSDTDTITDGTNTIQSITKDSSGSTFTIKYSNGTSTNTVSSTSISGALASAGISTSSIAGQLDTILNNADTSLSQIGSDLTVEVSQGIKTKYNVSASDLLEFKDSNLGDINTMNVLTDIINNLSTASNTSASDDDQNTAISNLNGTNLKQLDSIIDNFLSARSKVGTIQNRMDSASTTNEDQNYNMTNILSGVQDIDVAEKTVEYSSAQTIYKAALQVSSSVLAKTIMDYL